MDLKLLFCSVQTIALFINFGEPSDNTILGINKTIINNNFFISNINFKSMYGFKFIDDDSVQILIKNSDTVDILTDNILKYNTTKEIIYIIGLDSNKMINYGFNIFRENLNVWAFNVTALEPFFDGSQCEVFDSAPIEFKSFFNSIFSGEIKSSSKINKI